MVELGTVAVKPGLLPAPEDAERIDADPLRCLDPEARARMVAEVDAAKKDADTLGGIVEVLAYGVPPGLGSHVQWDRKLDARIAAALMLDPGDQGRRDRRRVHPGALARLGRRTTRSCRPRPACAG